MTSETVGDSILTKVHMNPDNETHHDPHRSSLGGPIKGLIGRTIGSFLIKGVIGQGSMGVVFEAEQIDLKRRVALKVLPPTLTHTEKVIKRFLREAESVAQLSHENIVEIYGIGESDGLYYYAMRYVPGESLDKRMRAGPMDPQEAAHYALQTARAIDYSHSQGIIHRDIKPSNLIVNDKTKKLVITDFGLARPERASSLTESGALVGTPVYMSPEQVRASRHELDRRTDIYSLGATLYELLTGRPPFLGDSTQEILQAILDDEPKRPTKLVSDLPIELEIITLKAMEKDPDRRFQSAAVMAQELDRFLSGEPIFTRGSTIIYRTFKRLRKHKRAATVVTVVSVVALVISFAASFLAADQVKKVKTSQLSEALTEGSARLASGEFDSARTKFEDILDTHPDHPDAEAGLGLALYRLGRETQDSVMSATFFRTALGHLNGAMEAGVDNGNVHFARGDIMMKSATTRREFELGLEEIFSAAERDQENFEVNLRVAELAFSALNETSLQVSQFPGKESRPILDFARETATRAVMLSPRSDEARVTRAKIYMELYEDKKTQPGTDASVYLNVAIEDIDRAIDINSNNLTAHEMKKQLAALRIKSSAQEDWKVDLLIKGIPLVQEMDFSLFDDTDITGTLVDLVPSGWRGGESEGENDVDALIKKAEMYRERGDLGEALKRYQAILEIQDRATIHWQIAQIQRRLSNLEGAIESLGRACELEPTHLDYLLSFHGVAEELGDEATVKRATEYFRVLFPYSDTKLLIQQLRSGEN